MLERRQEFEPTLKDGYIPAPYELEEGDCIRDAYLEPVIYHNDGGPDIGVPTCGVIVQDGLYFKDMDNDERRTWFPTFASTSRRDLC